VASAMIRRVSCARSSSTRRSLLAWTLERRP
jgi:hypothetical protein